MIFFQFLMQLFIPLMFVLVCFLIGKGIELHHFSSARVLNCIISKHLPNGSSIFRALSSPT
jgi:hypothetical protein